MLPETGIVAILKKADFIGYTIQPYLYTPSETKYISPVERITSLNYNSLQYPPAGAIELYQLAQELESSSLVTRFSKKNVNPKVFFGQKGNMVEEIVKPFIDQKMVEIIELINQFNIPLYDAAGMPHLYDTEKIKIVSEKATTLLKFDRTDTATVYILETAVGKHKIDLHDPSCYILTYHPCHLIYRNRLISFDRNINGKLLSPFLNKEFIEIPKHMENKYFSSFIRKIVNTSEIKATGFKVRDITLVPKAGLAYDIDWQGNPCLILKFFYGEKTILPNNLQKNFTDLTTDEEGFTFYRSKREKHWEDNQKELIKSMGLSLYDNCFRLPQKENESDPYSILEWLINNKEALLEKGFSISQDTSKQYCLAVSDIKYQVITNNDWFDLQIIVKAGDYEIPFTKLRNHLLHGKREFELPDGKIFLIPVPWFDTYRELLIHGVTDKHIIRLQKHHYRILSIFNSEETAYFEPYTPVNEPTLPELQNVILRPYQVSGFQWLVRIGELGFGGLLADDMGLGKTVQTIALLASYYKKSQSADVYLPVHGMKGNNYSNNIDKIQLDLFSEPLPPANATVKAKEVVVAENNPCSLLIMPASLIHNWVNEIERFAPYLKVLIYTGSGRKQSVNHFKKYQLLLTTYGTLRNDIDLLSKYTFTYIILDESQQIKNPSSKTAQAVFALKSKFKYALTGTPIENSLNDLWSQMNFVNPGLLGSLSVFNSFYAAPLAKDPEGQQSERLLSMIEPFILRRTKESVAPELPDLTETISYCSMSEEQSTLYESEKSKVRNLVFEQLEKGNTSTTAVMVLKALMLLRQVANHPRMIDSKSMIESGKFEEVTAKLETIVSEKHRVLIFSSFVKHLNIFEEYCKSREFKYAMLTGSTTNRGKVITEFKNNNHTGIFLISLKAGGIGLNLTEADYVFILDPWWNPAAEMQAVNRAHRIGQFKNVFVYRFITKDTIEEKILILQQKKKALADAFIKPQAAIMGMSREDILQLFE